MLPALIVAIVFSVPLAAIVGAYWVKLRRMEIESGASNAELRLRALEAEGRELRQRVEVLETIATSDAPSRTRVRVEAAARVADDDAAEVYAEAPKRSRAGG